MNTPEPSVTDPGAPIRAKAVRTLYQRADLAERNLAIKIFLVPALYALGLSFSADHDGYARIGSSLVDLSAFALLAQVLICLIAIQAAWLTPTWLAFRSAAGGVKERRPISGRGASIIAVGVPVMVWLAGTCVSVLGTFQPASTMLAGATGALALAWAASTVHHAGSEVGRDEQRRLVINELIERERSHQEQDAEPSETRHDVWRRGPSGPRAPSLRSERCAIEG